LHGVRPFFAHQQQGPWHRWCCHKISSHQASCSALTPILRAQKCLVQERLGKVAVSQQGLYEFVYQGYSQEKNDNLLSNASKLEHTLYNNAGDARMYCCTVYEKQKPVLCIFLHCVCLGLTNTLFCATFCFSIDPNAMLCMDPRFKTHVMEPFEALCLQASTQHGRKDGIVLLEIFGGIGSGTLVAKRLGIALKKVREKTIPTHRASFFCGQMICLKHCSCFFL
jgi:hypothetical protein